MNQIVYKSNAFFEETKCYIFLIISSCLTHYHSAACLPEVTGARTALHVCIYVFVSLTICCFVYTAVVECMYGC